MDILISISPEKDSERVLNYFYEKCLLSHEIGEIDSFEVKLMDNGKELKRGKKAEPKVMLKEEQEEIENGE